MIRSYIVFDHSINDGVEIVRVACFWAWNDRVDSLCDKLLSELN